MPHIAYTASLARVTPQSAGQPSYESSGRSTSLVVVGSAGLKFTTVRKRRQ